MAPTSDEEIQRQHQQALLLVEGNSCKPMPLNELGEINLKDKTRPTYPYAFLDKSKEEEDNGDAETESESDSESSEPQLLSKPHSLLNPICWSTRGCVDVTKLQDMVREGFDQDYRDADALPELSSTNFWDPPRDRRRDGGGSKSQRAWAYKKRTLLIIFTNSHDCRS